MSGSDVHIRQVPDGAGYVAVLAEEFGIDLPPDAAGRLRRLPTVA